MAADIRFKHPFTCIVSGPSGSGKSSFTLRLLQHLDSLCTEPNFSGGIIWCYSEKSAVPRDKLTSLHKNVSIHEGVPQNFGDDRGRPCLIILDDLLNEVYSKDVCDLFTKGSHHRNISVILITQNLFHQGRFCRDISLNAKYSVALKNVRDKSQFQYLARQVHPEDSDSLYKSYLEATERAHGYLILDFAQDTDDRLRYRTNVFPDEYPPIIYMPTKKGDEADKIELSRSASIKDGGS
jgi:hypothetical protein